MIAMIAASVYCWQFSDGGLLALFPCLFAQNNYLCSGATSMARGLRSIGA